MNTNHALSRDAFFAACEAYTSRQADIVKMPCEMLGGSVYVKILTPDLVEIADRSSKGNYDRAIYMVLYSIVDESGQQMFDSREQVGKLKLPLFNALSEAVTSANKPTPVEELAKN